MLVLKLLELLLGASSLCDLEDVEADSLAEGTALSDGDDVPDLDIPAKTTPALQGVNVLHSHLISTDICIT